ncbi:MAG: Crp/Fnr family transcriptional regulator [Sphingobacteriales bacterium]|nr:MAG: Crp/Fnr family transcriptional regulator [Sphingobacteriales bacterium]TAF81278.1 MAG: Crp/Fnr family transcriptional regulator [Sphingobacteriales bacterium]
MKIYKKEYPTENCFISNHCLPEWLPAINANKIIYEVKKGEVIFTEGTEVTGIYFVYEGNVKVHKKWGNDKELILRIATKGGIFGHRGLSSKSNIYPISATALENATVCFIDLAFFYTTIKVNPDFGLKLMLFFADELQESERKMRNLAHMSVKGRIAEALLLLKEKFGEKDGVINITLSRQDLASYVGATYETVFRTINELVVEKSISLQGKNIKLENMDVLKNLTLQAS